MKPRAFALELTKGCNLRCGYCYYAEREEAYDPRARMSPEVARRSVDLLLEEGPAGEPAHVHYFGGEPLLDFPLLRSTTLYGIERARALDRRITFEVTTNGTRLEPEVIAFLNEHGFAVGISFDGPPEVQDAARPLAGGSSYAQAAPKIRALLASRAGGDLAQKTHCSVVLTRRELDFVKIVRHLEGLGFEKILLTPATDLEGHSNGFRQEDLPRVRAAFDRLADEYEHGVRAGRRTAEAWFPRLMGRVLSGERRTHFCQGGRDYLGVAADGSVALCYRFFEDPEHAMGSVQEGIDTAVTERLTARTLDERTDCSRCWARWFCGGGCHHDNVTSTGDVETPNPVSCEIFRHSMGRTLEAWARLSRDGSLPRERATAPYDGAAAHAARARIPGRMGDDARPTTVEGTYVRELDGERIVYHPATHEVCVLNETAGFVFGLCDGTRTVRDMQGALERRYEAPAERLRQDLDAVLADLCRRGLVRE